MPHEHDNTPATADLKTLKSIYQDRWRVYGPSPQSLGWTKGKQAIRFHALLADLSCDGKSLLDVGCGFGDLNSAIRERGHSYTYHGIDMVPEFINYGRSRYGSPSTTFAVSDLDSDVCDRTFDYVVGIGIFGYRLADEDNYRYIERTLASMFARCTDATAVDFLSSHVTFRRESNFYADPARILSIALGMTRRVLLRHDYLPFEFGLVLFKDDSYDKDQAIFLGTSHA